MPGGSREDFRAEVTFQLGFGGRVGVLQASRTRQRAVQIELCVKAWSHERLGWYGQEAGKLSWSCERQVKFGF